MKRTCDNPVEEDCKWCNLPDCDDRLVAHLLADKPRTSHGCGPECASGNKSSPSSEQD